MKNKIIVFVFLLFAFVFIFAQEEIEQPLESADIVSNQIFAFNCVSHIEAIDYPNDDGSALIINWEFDNTANDFNGIFFLYRINGENKRKIAEITKDVNSYKDEGIDLNGAYQYALIALNDFGEESEDYILSEAVSPKANLFKKNKIILLLFILVYAGTIIYLVETVRRGKVLFLRKIAGLDALDEAVGRATEMGRPILYVPGISSMSDIATIASLNILGPVAKKVAEYDSKIIVPNKDPIVMTVAKEVVKEAYTEAGRPDTYNDNDVFFLTDSQFGYAAAVNGIMVREKPATNLFLGMFFAESLILAETGNTTGAIQIAGTDAVTQLPFFITSCDYTIIGEELYAASAYLSHEPVLMGSIKAQDYMKGFIILCIILFFIIYFINGITGDKINFLKTIMNIISYLFNT